MLMELLLKENVDNLGVRGDIVKVKAGYGRNYLIPKGLAMAATTANLKVIERERLRLSKQAAEEKATAVSLSEKLAATALVFTRKVGDHGNLYGSVTSIDVAEALNAKGIEIERRKVVLKDPIKEIGEFDIPVKLHRDVTATVKVTVAPEEAPAAS
jgi:large subunit ribosomal protein L9